MKIANVACKKKQKKQKPKKPKPKTFWDKKQQQQSKNT